MTGDPADRLVNSAILTIVARLAMVVAAGAMPVAGWMLTRSINTVDEVSSKIDRVKELAVETSFNVKLIQQTLQLQTQALQDHETRVRVLENRPRTP